jgi:hypothetical protein
MAKFISVKSYHRGVGSPPSDMVLNVDHVVSFWGGCMRLDGVQETPCVYIDTTQIKGVIIEGTVSQLADKLSGQCGLTSFSSAKLDAKQWDERLHGSSR